MIISKKTTKGCEKWTLVGLQRTFAVGGIRTVIDCNGKGTKVFVLNLKKYHYTSQCVNMDVVWIDELIMLVKMGHCADYVLWEAQEMTKGGTEIPTAGFKQWKSIPLSTIIAGNKQASRYNQSMEWKTSFTSWTTVSTPNFVKE